jgi:pyrroloquinoline quinone (PQQ) biosynthesis protein C
MVGFVLPQEVAAKALSLKGVEARHPFWENKLFKACEAGLMTKEDFKFLWEQFYAETKNFTRYLAGVMYNCENDYYRAALAQNIYEESGEEDLSERHSEIYRRFLRDSLGVDPEQIKILPGTKKYVDYVIKKAGHENSTYGSAMIFCMEGITARAYTILRDAMLKSGFSDNELRYFNIHIACDDDHAAVLEEMMYSTHREPGWFETCTRATDEYLQNHTEFFDWVFDETVKRRLSHAIEPRIAAQSVNVRSDREKMLIQM